MKYILIFLLCFSSLFAQFIEESTKPILYASDVDLGTFVQSATPDTNSLGITVNLRSATVDTSYGESGLTVLFDSAFVVPADTIIYLYYVVDISTNGNYSKTITISNTATNPDKSVTVTWSVQAAEGSISAPTSLAITDSADGLYLDWDNNTESISGYKIYRSTDNSTYSLLTTVVNSNYNDTDIIEALRYYYYVTAYKSTESTSSDTVNSKSLVTLANYDAVIYIDSTAGATRNGTYAQPYKYLSEVIWEDLDEGTYGSGTNIKIFIKGGYKYTGGISMLDVDASASDPIVIDVYGSLERPTLRLSSYTSSTNIIQLASTGGTTASSYITFKNMEIEGYRWVYARKTQHITFDNCYFHFYTEEDPYLAGGTPFDVKYSDMNIYMTIKNCIFVGGISTDLTDRLDNLVDFQRSHSVLIENNYFRNVNHVLLGTDRANYLVIRGNRFYNTLHGALNIQTDNSTPVTSYLVENNYFERSGIGYDDFDLNPQGSAAYVYLNGQYIIFRNNLIKQSGGYTTYNMPALDIKASSQGLSTSYNRIYNNTIYNNYGIGLQFLFSATGTAMTDNYVFNNAFVKNGNDELTYSGSLVGTDSTSIIIDDENLTYDPSGNYVTYNYFGSDAKQIHSYSNVHQFYTSNAYTGTGISFSNNIDNSYSNVPFDDATDSISVVYWGANGEANFLDSLALNFNPTSELQNAGRHIATVTSSSGTTLTVSDGKAFFSGFGWLDGDSIRITYGESISYNRITGISGNDLTLATSGSYTAGSYVDIVNSQLGSYSGSGVDIGMFEYQTTDTLAPSSLSPFVVYVDSDSANFGLNFKTNYETTDLIFQIALVNDNDELNDNSFIPIPSPVLGTSGTSTINHGSSGLSLGQVYYYRWVLTNSKGTTTGSIQTYIHEIPTAVTGETSSSVANNYDDLAYYSGGTNNNANYVGNYSSTSVNTALRFPSITVAQSSTVDSSFITLTANNNYSNTNCNLRIYGELRESPDSVTVFTPSGSAMSARSDSVTTAYVDTTMGAWTQDVEYRIDVTTIVQELVNTHNYSGQPISFFIKDNTSTALASRIFYRYEDGSKYARINIYYTE